MVKDALVKTNPYLRKSALRRKLLLMAATTSTAIEGVHIRISMTALQKKTTSKHA
jgi:hypothetical protein